VDAGSEFCDLGLGVVELLQEAQSLWVGDRAVGRRYQVGHRNLLLIFVAPRHLPASLVIMMLRSWSFDSHEDHAS
jgi:hypothetical protein